MSQPPSPPPETPYWCFISYRHADDKARDRAWASWLHQEIERYEVPAELVGTWNKRGDVIPERIYPVFRDEVSLPADADLASSITQALDRSRSLVVLCSPRAVESRYVAQEVLHFKQAGKADRIVAAILDGEPGHGASECFPAPLRHPVGDDGELDPTREVEPIAADFRLPDGCQGFTSAEAYRLALTRDGTLEKRQVKARADAYELTLQLMKLKIIAGILGVPLEQLRNRDKAYQLELARRRARALRRWLAALGVLTVLVLAAGIIANRQRIRAQMQEFIAMNQTLETSLELVTRFWRAGDVPQAAAGLSRAAALARQIKDHPRATEQEREREAVLRRELDLMRHGWRVLGEPEGVRDYAWSADGTRLATLSEQGRLRLFEMSPQGDLFALDFRGPHYLKQDTSGQLEEVQVSSDSVEELSFDVGRSRWLGRVQHAFVTIDPTNGQATAVLGGDDDAVGPAQSRLLSASGRHYAYRCRMQDGVTVQWRELADGESQGAVILKPPGKAGELGGRHFDCKLAMLSITGATLAVPVLGGAHARMELYDTGSGSFAGVFTLPPGRKYDGVRYSPTDHVLAAPAPYGLELWSPFQYDPTPASEAGSDNVMLEVDDAGAGITLEPGEPRRALGLLQLRGPDEVQHGLTISSALRWPDRNHILVGFSDLKIGSYQLEPFTKLALWTHAVDEASLTESQKFILRVQGSPLHLAFSPDRRHFISWSEYGGAQIWNRQQTGVKGRALGALRDIDQILYSPSGRAIWAVHHQEAGVLSVFRAEESPSLLRTIPVDFRAGARKTAPDFGIVLAAERWPHLIIDPHTGMSLASYFRVSRGPTTPGAFALRDGDESLLLRIDLSDVGVLEDVKDERRTGYRWRAGMAAPRLLSWDELREVWGEGTSR